VRRIWRDYVLGETVGAAWAAFYLLLAAGQFALAEPKAASSSGWLVFSVLWAVYGVWALLIFLHQARRGMWRRPSRRSWDDDRRWWRV
jgi:hypothetical protein